MLFQPKPCLKATEASQGANQSESHPQAHAHQALSPAGSLPLQRLGVEEEQRGHGPSSVERCQLARSLKESGGVEAPQLRIAAEVGSIGPKNVHQRACRALPKAREETHVVDDEKHVFALVAEALEQHASEVRPSEGFRFVRMVVQRCRAWCLKENMAREGEEKQEKKRTK